ncbi:SMP-30/gluconolactonase/LRE family protein [Occultella kanbiaonis]|uniref:SMP-30/gluconolactonase/LRE family protein n=1 Tax=Occultella kanbiaonis TaxID=2675754 RepID=UPI001B355339|nr:SMP-30/gluconolactonase/LRE family protein [Occultella kanbiaonis]
MHRRAAGRPDVATIRTEWEIKDERFRGIGGDRFVQVLFEGGRWLEGPVYSPAWRSVLFSDIPNDRVLRLDETTGAVGVWREGAGFANGRTLDRAGRIVSCEHGTRSVTRIEPDGTRTVLADAWDGHPLNSPNDVVTRADGTIWFTDPAYGIDTVYEGHRAETETGGCHVYRIGTDGTVTRVADDFDRPNGLAFSADERTLYVTDTGRRHLRRFTAGAPGAPGTAGTDHPLSGGEVIAECDAGGYDGIRLDAAGRIWAAAADGLHCLAPDGTLLGKLRLPEICSNLTFGGPRGNTLFVTATNTLYSLMVNVTGARYPAATAH